MTISPFFNIEPWIPCDQPGCTRIIEEGEKFYADIDKEEVFCASCYKQLTLSPDEKAGI